MDEKDRKRKDREDTPGTRPGRTPYELPQESGEPDPWAVHAAKTGIVPDAEAGLAGESAPGSPSRAEIFALNPELAGEDGVSGGGPTMPVGPDEGLPYTAGAPVQGKTEPVRSAPPSERPADTSTPEERHEEMAPPKASEDRRGDDGRAKG